MEQANPAQKQGILHRDEIMKNYQVYSNAHVGSVNGAGLGVRITYQGTFTFNIAVAKLFEAENIKSVFILWDAESRSIAFRKAEEDELGAFKLHQGYRVMHFRKKSFSRDVGWDIKETITLRGTWNEGEKMLELEPIPSEK